jgi:hypothetical protein
MMPARFLTGPRPTLADPLPCRRPPFPPGPIGATRRASDRLHLWYDVRAMDSTPLAAPRAVVWTAPRAAPPPDLITALGRGGMQIEVVASPFLALAHLCRAESRDSAGFLVVVEPDRLPGAGHVCECAERYAPQIKAWMYTGANPPAQRLRGIAPADIQRWLEPGAGRVVIAAGLAAVGKSTRPSAKIAGPQSAPLGSVAPRVRPAGGPKLRLTEAPQVQDPRSGADLQGSTEADASDNSTRSVLTSEELEMLLNDAEPGS